jgi:MFS family permease
MVLGILYALANVIESAHQSWSARQLEAVLHAPPRISALGPSVFALATATLRLVNHHFARNRTPARMVLAAGAGLAAIGTATVALAPTIVVGLAGVAVAGLGVGVCAPTIISSVGAEAAAGEAGARVSTLMTTAYLGFVSGPAVVGFVAGHAGLRSAFGVIAGVALVLGVLSLMLAHAADAHPYEHCDCSAAI